MSVGRILGEGCMGLQFNDLSELYTREEYIWSMDDITKKSEDINNRFEQILLRSVKMRDDVRKGIVKSDEEIEISIYQWIHRYLPKTDRYYYVDDVIIGNIQGRIICDLFQRHLEFEPVMTKDEFLVAYSQSEFAQNSKTADDQILSNDKNINELCHRYNVQQVFSFGGTHPRDSDKLALLVKKGIKSATSSLYDLYEIDNEKLPRVGDKAIILYEDQNVCCMTELISVDIKPFSEVTREDAFMEGEGDRSLEYWKLVHHVFFHRELKEYNKSFSEDMLVVVEKFKKICEPMDYSGLLK